MASTYDLDSTPFYASGCIRREYCRLAAGADDRVVALEHGFEFSLPLGRGGAEDDAGTLEEGHGGLKHLG